MRLQHRELKQEHPYALALHLFLPAKPARDGALSISRLLLHAPIHLVDFVSGVLAEPIELLLALLSDLRDTLVQLELGAGVVDLQPSCQ